jgi:predicted metalloprotease with PDZ domain
MSFPNLPDENHWMEEGLATYVEPIARVEAGQLDAKTIWRDMMDGMPKGEPGAGDEGLDRTHTWGRTYWGGALFCLVADIEIRKETKNRKGLQDALRAIVAAGGTIDQDWPITRAIEIEEKATGTQVMRDMYATWSV